MEVKFPRVRPNQSVPSLTATERLISFCFPDKDIGVIDINAELAQSVLEFSMGEHMATNMYYYPATDTLCLFVIATKEGNNDGLLFLHNNGRSWKYLFRKFTPVLAV
jgi:hypothetical protein